MIGSLRFDGIYIFALFGIGASWLSCCRSKPGSPALKNGSTHGFESGSDKSYNRLLCGFRGLPGSMSVIRMVSPLRRDQQKEKR
jgi:hypothetical protein